MRDKQQQILELKAHARGYANALWSHCCTCGNEEARYLQEQAVYVSRHAEEIVDMLAAVGVESIDWKHLQYFFAVCPHVYEPYQALWYYIEQRMREEDGIHKPASLSFTEHRDTRRWPTHNRPATRAATELFPQMMQALSQKAVRAAQSPAASVAEPTACPSFYDYAKQEPGLLELERDLASARIEILGREGTGPDEVWYRQFKPRFLKLIGHYREADSSNGPLNLNSEAAYRTCYEALIEVLEGTRVPVS